MLVYHLGRSDVLGTVGAHFGRCLGSRVLDLDGTKLGRLGLMRTGVDLGV